jgi:hypothetical protein
LSHQSQNKDNLIGNGNRTIEFETYQLQGVFPNVKQEDIFSLQNGNKAIQLVFDAKTRWHVNRFEILMEFLYDYPNSPPNVKVIKPDVTGAPHTIFNNTMCYNNPSIDWKPSYTSYDVAIMIQSWIYAYCKWIENGIWDWYQDVEYIPPPPAPNPPIKKALPTKQTLQTIESIKNEITVKQDQEYYKTPLYYCCNNPHTNREQIEEDKDKDEIYNTQIHSTLSPNLHDYNPNNYNNSNYGRTDIDNYIDNSYGRAEINDNRSNNESPSIAGRIIFATIFSLMFLAYNHLTTIMVIAPFFALLFISKKSRTILFIILSLFIIVSNPWSFVIVPVFGLLYTKKKKFLFPILSAIILFWIFIALYGYNIVDLQIFKYQ